MRHILLVSVLAIVASASLAAQDTDAWHKPVLWNAYSFSFFDNQANLFLGQTSYISQLTVTRRIRIIRVEMAAQTGSFSGVLGTDELVPCSLNWRLAITDGTSILAEVAVPSNILHDEFGHNVVGPVTADSGPMILKVAARTRLRLFTLPGNDATETIGACAPPGRVNISIQYKIE
jgi:hypothetical protein